MKAIILSRVSSKDQEEGYSIAAQTAKLKEYCQHKNLSILKIYEITESSTVGERKQFKDMIAYVKELHSKTQQRTAIVVDAVDRLMRNFSDQPMLNELMMQDVIELHFARTNTIIHKDSNSNERMMWNFNILMAQAYVDALRDNVKRSRDFKIKRGEYISLTPLGYTNIPKNQRHGGADVILDETRCFLIKRLFQEYATGTHTLQGMTVLAKRWGLYNRSGKPLIRSQMHRILQDKFYIGIMTVCGNEYPHNYPPIVDEETFERCQRVRLNANKKPFKYKDKPFIFRGMVRCKECGNMFSSYIKKERYVYLRPPHGKDGCGCKPMRQEAVLEQVEEVFKAIYIPETLMADIKGYVKQSHAAKADYHAKLITSLRKESDDIQRKLDRLVDLLIEQSITQSIYDKKVYDLKTRQHDIERQLSAHSNADETFYYTLSALLELTSKAHECFVRANIEQKRKLLNLLFSNLEMDGTTLCYTLQKPFNTLVNLSESEDWRVRRDSNPRPSA